MSLNQYEVFCFGVSVVVVLFAVLLKLIPFWDYPSFHFVPVHCFCFNVNTSFIFWHYKGVTISLYTQVFRQLFFVKLHFFWFSHVFWCKSHKKGGTSLHRPPLKISTMAIQNSNSGQDWSFPASRIADNPLCGSARLNRMQSNFLWSGIWWHRCHRHPSSW